MEQLLFTRPFWFLALPPMAVMLRILLKNRRTASPWRGSSTLICWHIC